MGMPVGLRKSIGVNVARGTKQLWKEIIVAETDMEETEDENSDGSKMVCFIRDMKLLSKREILNKF